MGDWTLEGLLSSLHERIHRELAVARKSFGHAGATGAASEGVWVEFLQEYLPKRYEAASAFVVDSHGHFSQQIDLLIFDRQYSPFIFRLRNQTIIPAESVYAVFEAKQELNGENIRYAQEKIASVRRLHRTSQPIPHAGGLYAEKLAPPIIGGLLTLESVWADPLGDRLHAALEAGLPEARIDLGCVAAHGVFMLDEHGAYRSKPQARPATAFLFELLARLQALGTVPMIDVRAYAKWLD